MAIRQLSVYLENKPGTLADAIRRLSDAGVNLKALNLADTAEFGILRLITDDIEKAVQVLSQNTIVRVSDVIAVKMDDRSGGLQKILEAFEETKVNIEYMYAFSGPDQSAYGIFRVNDTACAESCLKAKRIDVIGDIPAE